MIGKPRSQSDAKIRQLRLIAFGFTFLLVATMIGGAVIGFKTINRLNIIQSDWLEFRHVTENKGQSLSQIRNYFGFGGFIHNFQNYVSERDPDLGGVVRRDIDELLAAVATYEVVGVSEAERAALADIRKVIAIYRSNLQKAERLVSAGGNPDVDTQDAEGRVCAGQSQHQNKGCQKSQFLTHDNPP